MSNLIKTAINNVEKVYDQGYKNGHKTGYKDGTKNSIEEGKKQGIERIWKTIQNYGDSDGQNYYYAFAHNRYTDYNFKPSYSIIFSNIEDSAKYAFYKAQDLTDTRTTIDASYPLVVMEKTFAECENLRIIRTLFVAKETKFIDTFLNCGNLEYLILEGELGQNGFNLKDSPKLNAPSIVSIIESLSSTTSNYTIILSQTAIDNMVFPYTSGRTNITYNSWNELKNSKINWNIELI